MSQWVKALDTRFVRHRMSPSRSLLLLLARYLAVALVVIAIAVLQRYCGLDDEVNFGPGERIVVLDGDTLRVGDTKYRIFGIDAPELAQTCNEANGQPWPCGRKAESKLRALIARGPVQCEPRARDRFDRIVASCSTEGVPDLGEALVHAGLALSFGGFGEGPYADAEMEAQVAKRGIWRGTFDRPADWRQAHPRLAD